MRKRGAVLAILLVVLAATGAAAGGLAAYSIGVGGANTARIIGGFALAANILTVLSAGSE